MLVLNLKSSDNKVGFTNEGAERESAKRFLDDAHFIGTLFPRTCFLLPSAGSPALPQRAGGDTGREGELAYSLRPEMFNLLQTELIDPGNLPVFIGKYYLSSICQALLL